jgi:hypothetical protein
LACNRPFDRRPDHARVKNEAVREFHRLTHLNKGSKKLPDRQLAYNPSAGRKLGNGFNERGRPKTGSAIRCAVVAGKDARNKPRSRV